MRGNTTMKNIFTLNLLALLLGTALFSPLHTQSHYYYQDFSGTKGSLEANGWDFDFPMNRFFLAENTTNAGTPYFWVSNQQASNYLYLYGDPNADPIYDQWYTGKGAIFRMLNNPDLGAITATPEHPFGFQVIRYNAWVHRDAGPVTFTPDNTGNNDDDYGKGLLEVWLLEDNGAVIEGDGFDNFVFWFDKAYNHDNANNKDDNVWGYYNQSERDVQTGTSWSNFVDIDGQSMDPNTHHRKQYSYANYQATNELGIKMVHDGSKVTIFINLDPLGDSSPLYNSWVKFAEMEVAWSENLGIYFAAESPTPEGNGVGPVWTYTMAQFGDLLIRSVVSNITASISPKKVRINTEVTFDAEINISTLSVDDSGVGEIYIEAPAGYHSFDTGSVEVTHPTEGVLNRQTAALYGYGSLGANDFYAGTREGMLYIRLNMSGTDAENHILTNGTLSVRFAVTTGPSPDADGDDFKIYGDAVKHRGTGQDIVLGGAIKYATTGRKKAYPVSEGELTVQVYDQPAAYADVQYSPRPLIVGNEQASFTVRVSTEGLVNTPDISKLRIQIPAGFTVSNNSVDWPIESSVLKASAVSSDNIFVSNDYIYVWYTNIGGLPGTEGRDKIQFTVWGTPSGMVGAFTNYQWKSYVNSEEIIAGTSWQIAGTNSTLKSQDVRVAMSNAQVLGYVVTRNAPSINAKTGIFTNTAWNTNNYDYVIYNDGDTGNDVSQVRITIPDVFDQVSSVVSSNGGSTSVSGGYIYVDYPGKIQAGQKDVISFTARHSITNINSAPSNAAFILYADNLNSAGLTLQSQDAPRNWSVTISPPLPSAENRFSPTVIYTTEGTNNLSMDLYNTSPNGVGLNLVRIDVPSAWFTFADGSSTHLADDNNITLTNVVAGTNSILIRYYADGNGALPSYYDSSSGDSISLQLWDNISYNSFSIMPTNISFPVFVYKTAYLTNDTNFYSVSTIGERFPGTNELSIEYPYLDAAYYITNKDNNQLSSTTVTNQLTYFLVNQGDAGNRITNVYINIPDDVSTNFWVNSVSKGSAQPQINASQNRIWVNFPSPLDGNETMVLRFSMVDIVDAEDKANVYLYPDVENNRGLVSGLTNIVSSKSGKIDFSLPKPNGGGGASPSVFFVTKGEPVGTVVTQDFRLVFTNTGVGTDQFKAVQVNIPQPLRGQVYNIASQKLGTDLLSSGSYFSRTSSNFQVLYNDASDPVLAGEGDVLTVTVHISNVNSLPTNGVWGFLADNGFVDNGFAPPKRYFELTNISLGSLSVSGAERLSVNLVSDVLTTEITNTFSYTIKNGSAGNLPVDQVRIKIPQPPYVSVNPATIFVSGVSADVSVSGGYIWVTNFSGGGLPGGGQSTLTITALKSILVDSTNVEWEAEAYYTADSSYQPLQTRGTNSEEIQLPPPDFYAYVNETQIGKDNIRTELAITITNVGATGNRISLLKIIPPTTNENLAKMIITNVDMLSSTLTGDVWYSNDGIIYVDYTTDSTNLPAKRKDVISLRAWDNQANIGFSGEWKVYAASKSGQAVTNASRDAVDIGQSLDYTLIVPAYGSSYYVTPNSVSTVSSSNPISVYINNTGGGANNLLSARILLEYPFVTSGLIVNTLKGTNYVIGSNYVEVYYRDGAIAPASNDVVTLTLADSFTYGETNTVLEVSARYNTSGSIYVDSGVVVGEDNGVAFEMPYPDVVSEVLYNDVYTSQDKARLTVRFINKGTGSNALQRLKIYVPSGFSTGLNSTLVADSLATNKSVVSNEITLWYDSFVPGVTNTLVLDLTNTRKTKGKLYMESYAFNGLKETTTVGVLDSKTNHVVSPPSAEIVDQVLESPDVVNNVEVKLYNDSDGTSSIYYARVNVPAIFTNLVSVSSALGTVVSNTVNNIVVYYPSGLPTGGEDTISLALNDNQDMFETTGLSWSVGVNNLTGWGNVLPFVTGALSQSMIIPMPEVTNQILTRWYQITTGIEVPTNTFVVLISNQSVGNNRVSSNVIILPSQMTDVVGSVTVSHPGAEVSLSGNRLSIVYTNAGLFTGGETNRVSFKFRNLVTLQAAVNMEFYAYNGTSLGSDNGALKRVQTINFNAPQNPTEAYVQNKQILYSIDHDAEILYHINNGLFDLEIEQVRIQFTNILKITNIYSELFGQSLAFTTNSNTIQLDYRPLGNIPNRQDASGGRELLHIYVVYTNSSSFTNRMGASVLFEETIEYSATKKPTGENNFVPVLLANFGRISGIVLPGRANPTVRLYYSGTTTEVTNQFTNLIISGADANGRYTLDFIPALGGVSYDVAFNGENYTSLVMTGILVSNNFITYAGTSKMIRDLFSLSATTPQVSLSLDDLATEVIVPSGIVKDRFSLNIWLTNLSSLQQEKLVSGAIDNPNDPSSLQMFWFDMKDYNGNTLEEVELNGDVYVKLSYAESNLTAQGWSENSLAVYYWNEESREWKRIGGTVDSVSNYVVIRTSYLRKNYAILGEGSLSVVKPGFIEVNVYPKVFTPASGDNQYANVKISASFEESVESYTVRIYNLQGILVKEYVRDDGGYSQGEVFWDGVDQEGFSVRSGVYVYRITAGENSYTGTIVIAR